MRIIPAFIATFALGLLLVSCSEQPDHPLAPGATDENPTFAMGKGGERVDLTDRYIVVFKRSTGQPDQLTDRMLADHGGKLHFRYRHALRGFAATLPPGALDAIRRNPNVEYVEPDGIMTAIATQNNPPSWGLDRIDQRNLPRDYVYTYDTDGSGVNIYIIDTGIRPDHQEFRDAANATRVKGGYNFVDSNPGNWQDCNGHGTHVAGTAAGLTVGAAKNAWLYSVRVLDCGGSGTVSGVTAGIDWVSANHVKPAVANMSLGGGYSQAINDAVNNSVNNFGVVYAVAAGNNRKNACNYSPASAAAAITVGATTNTDARASYSNYGSCLDIFAPGSSIYSSTMTGTNTYETWSGTSMASPHAAGVAALYMQANASATPVQVTAAIVNGATTGVLSNIGTGSPNRLLYSRLTTIAPPSPPAAPSALVATAVNSSSISLSWQDNSDNELGFKIERSDNGSSGWLQVGIVGAGIKTFANTGLAAQTRYYYRVCAYNNDGNSVYSNTADAVTPAATSVTVFVENLYGFATTNPAGWFGNLEVTVFNSNNTAQSGVSVNVSWSGAVSGSASAVTGSNGKCTITTQRIGKNVPGSVTMTVTNLSGTGVTYAPLSNKENFETIYKP